jgi:serine/threonine protein kinase
MDVTKKVSKSKNDFWKGKIIAEKYQLETLIGAGGMGAVYIGKHLQLGRTVAVKVMNTDIAGDQTASARFIREAKASAKLEHPNTVTIHDFGMIDDDAGAFIVMEYISGQTLRRYLINNGPLSLEKALEWFFPMCDAIETAHQKGIIHRDLKPENIMLKNVGNEVVVKVVDFGLAKISSDSGVSVSQKLTQTGEFMGTPQYMAPEVYDGETADHRADIYALGIILYEMITGKVPFGGSVQHIISGHLFKDPPLTISLNPNLPVGLDEILKLALEKKREDRINSALAFANAFKQFVDPNGNIKFSFLSGGTGNLESNLIAKNENGENVNTGLNLIEPTGKSKASAATLVNLDEELPTLQDSLPKTLKINSQNIIAPQQKIDTSLNKKEGVTDNLSSVVSKSTDANILDKKGFLFLLKEKPWIFFVGVGIIFVVLALVAYMLRSSSLSSEALPKQNPSINTPNLDGSSTPTPSAKKAEKILSETKPVTEDELRKELEKKKKNN